VPFYGDVFDDYLPDYYLGIAYLNVKRFADADRSFELVRTSKLIGPRDKEFAQFDESAPIAIDPSDARRCHFLRRGKPDNPAYRP